jgi:hypothetical protein
MQDDDILHLEAMELLRNASDELLRLSTIQEIDLNSLAHIELRYRRRSLGHHWVGALARDFEP